MNTQEKALEINENKLSIIEVNTEKDLDELVRAELEKCNHSQLVQSKSLGKKISLE